MGDLADYYVDYMTNEWNALRQGHQTSYDDFEGTSYDNMLWITKEGSKLLIREMERFHLENCKRMMERDQTTDFIQYQRICEELLSRTGAEDFK